MHQWMTFYELFMKHRQCKNSVIDINSNYIWDIIAAFQQCLLQLYVPIGASNQGQF